jgi:O-antigen ligase
MLVLKEYRVRGFTSTALIFGNISLLFSLFSFLSIRHYLNNNKNIIFPIVASGASFFAWGATGSRGSIILIIVFIILLMTKPFKKILNLSTKLALAITLVAFIIFINSFALARYINAYESKYNYITEDSKFNWMHSDSIVPRLSIWKGSKNIISDNILLGVGLNNFNIELEKQISEKKIKPIRYDYGSGPSQKRVPNLTAGLNHAHNQYLDIFVKTGVFGFLVLIFFITMNLYFFMIDIECLKKMT